MSDWQPIETAPKDGTEIVGRDQVTGTAHVTFADQYGDWYNPDSHYYSEAPPYNPTHWAAIPPWPLTD